MTVKTSGLELKLFYADGVAWPTGMGHEVWHDDEIICVNGIWQEDGIDIDAIADTDKITIEGGIVYSPRWVGDEPSLEAYFKKWRKEQNTVTLVVTCDREKLDLVKEAIATAGGKVAN